MRAPNKTLRRARELRREMSLPEVVLWQALRKGRLAGLRVRRQHPIGPYILDFYCPYARLAIEVDGLAHDTAAVVRHDEARQAWLVRQGVTVLRVRASEVLRDERLEGMPPRHRTNDCRRPLRLALLATSPAPRGRSRPLLVWEAPPCPARADRDRVGALCRAFRSQPRRKLVDDLD